MKRKKKIIQILLVSAFFVLSGVSLVWAQTADLGLSYGDQIGLSSQDPRIMIANVIRIVLGFLGIIGVGLMMYAGWLWMTATGDQDRITKAKKIMSSAAIGLVIILSSFGIVSFVLNRLADATGITTPGGPDDPGVPLGGGPDFIVTSTLPRDNQTAVARNMVIRAFFSLKIDAQIDLNQNFKIEKIGAVDPETGAITASETEAISGATTIARSEREIKFTAAGDCGNGATGCLPEWSRVRVVLNGASGIISAGGSSLVCSGSRCQFEFSTDDSVDSSFPSAGIEASQICREDGTLPAEANIVGGWGRDSGGGIGEIDFYYRRAAATEVFSGSVDGNGEPYQFAYHKYNTAGMEVGEDYVFKIRAEDLSGREASDSFPARIRPGHCCNGIKDADETAVDCGGVDCESCESQNPVINYLDPADGKAGNFITIFGRNFGGEPGKVYFWNGNGFSAEAASPSSVNEACGNGWSDRQIVVVVPVNAVDGPVKIVRADGKSDATDDGNGPQIDDFDVNDVARPGLCLVNPASGKYGDSFTVSGASLSEGSKAVFGLKTAGIEAPNARGWNGSSFSANVPNLSSGASSVFVRLGEQSSNSLFFTILSSSAAGPEITEIDPASGARGQYLTIRGLSFGVYDQAKSRVNFYFKSDPNNPILADIDFPADCQGRFWYGNHIVVKVPKTSDLGNYGSADNYEIEVVRSDGAKSPRKSFRIIEGSAGPGICRLDPSKGPVGAAVSVYGDNFGSYAQSSSRAVFYQNKNGEVSSADWSPQAINTKVPSAAATGPFAVARGNVFSNTLPFSVGRCFSSSDCALGEECCANGVCRSAGTCETNLNRVCEFKWSFTAGTGSTECSAGETVCGGVCCSIAAGGCRDATASQCAGNCRSGQYLCDSGDCCNILCEGPVGGTSCAGNMESCSGYNLNTCGFYEFCPNSPGKCSAYSGGPVDTGVSCSDSACSGGACVSGNCSYNSSLNRCVLGGASCGLTKQVSGLAGNQITANCEKYNSTSRWVINTDASCPSGWTRIASGKCADLNSNCDLCADGFKCLGSGETGVCAIDKPVCPSMSQCSGGRCLETENGSCECCCEIGQDTRDCCAPLKCEGNCGSDRVSDSDRWGYCSGCATAGSTIAERDAACNCAGHSGKYCNANIPGGVCVDCSALPAADCSAHPACCLDAANGNVCRGAGGSDTVNENGNRYCGYYSCKSGSSGEQCAGPEKEGNYKTSNCNNECGRGNVGESCNQGTETAPACDVDFCSSGYQCFSDQPCGNCCCDLAKSNTDKDTCRNINLNLFCGREQDFSGGCYDRDPNTAPNFGVCCGCSTDASCGNANTTGCGSDTCCHARPKITAVSPASGSASCGNVLITAEFDQKMEISSFTGNVIVAGEYSGECPSGTRYLALDGAAEKKAGVFSRFQDLFAGLIRKINPGEVRAAPRSDRNYCAVSGTVSGYQRSDGGTTLFFETSSVFENGRTYFVIIKGDGNLADSAKEGVLNASGVGMKGPNSGTFNGLNFQNAKIWSFTAKALCSVNNVSVSPSSYLFQTTVNDLNENDSNPNNATFDTKADADKVFRAFALSASGQALAPVSGYRWSWTWASSNPDAVDFIDVSSLPGDRKLIRAKEGITDSSSLIDASAAITQNTYGLSGDGKSGLAEVWVFTCQNPWPAVKDGLWSPWKDAADNCSSGLSGESCAFNGNFEFYYCRDAGGAGTADDLPAILSDKTIIRGRSSAQDMLKEFYFFREGTPDISNVDLKIKSIPAEGGKVEFYWNAALAPAGESLKEYRVYFRSDPNQSYSDAEWRSVSINGTVSSPFTVSGLDNGKTYYFAITAVYQSGAESGFSNEVSANPLDTAGPAAPTIAATAKTNSVAIGWTDQSGGDAKAFRIFYRASETCSPSDNFAVSTAAAANPTTVSGLSGGTKYCFGLVAYDQYGNPSATSTILAIPN